MMSLNINNNLNGVTTETSVDDHTTGEVTFR